MSHYDCVFETGKSCVDCQLVQIDFDALDASYIPGTEFCFWASLAECDPFQEHLTATERSKLMDGDCGGLVHLRRVSARINHYWMADD